MIAVVLAASCGGGEGVGDTAPADDSPRSGDNPFLALDTPDEPDEPDEDPPIDPGADNAVATPTPSPIVLDWWFSDPCEASVDNACIPRFGGERSSDPTHHVSPEGSGLACSMSEPCALLTAIEEAGPGSIVHAEAGEYPVEDYRIKTDGLTIEGPLDCCAFVPSMRVEAARIRLLGMRFDTVVVSPPGDDTLLAWNRLGSLFVNGADNVEVIGNRLRPHAPGQDVIQVKAIDDDGVDGLLIEGNVIGPQDSADGSHTDCVQLLDGDDVMVRRNIVFACGDKAFQLRSGVGGTVGSVVLEANVLYECGVRRDGCNGFHAIIWASTPESRLELRHNTIFGSVVTSTSGSTIDAGDNFLAVGNLASSLICTDGNFENQQVDKDPCNDTEFIAPYPPFVDASPLMGDARLSDPDQSPPRATQAFGPGIDGTQGCAQPRIGAAIDC